MKKEVSDIFLFNLVVLIIIKIFSTFFFLNIYADYATIGDANGYLRRTMVFDWNFYFPYIFFDRSHFVESIYAVSNTIFTKYLTPYLFSILSIYIIWNSLKSYYISSTNSNTKYIVLIILFSPSFMLWTSVPGKELISISLYFLLINYFVKIMYKDKINYLYFLIISLILLLIRPNYTAVYLFFFIILLIKNYFLDYISFKYKIKISYTLLLLFYFILLCIFIITFLLFYNYWSEFFYSKILYKSHSMFYAFQNVSSTMRNEYLEWNNIFDFIKNLILGSYTAFSGPTFHEIIKRPILFIYFFEGIFINLIIIYFLIKIINVRNKIYNFSFIFVFGLISSYILLIIMHYPLGIFNLGSSMRYKQNLIPFFVFLPYMILHYKPDKFTDLE